MINREKYSYYPEAYAWMLTTTGVNLVIDAEWLMIFGCVPGVILWFYFYYVFVRDTRAAAAMVKL